MKILIGVLVIIPLAIIILFFIKGQQSQKGNSPGIIDGKLQRCSSKPNCVCSEFADDSDHYSPPMSYDNDSGNNILALIKDTIEQTGGVVETEEILVDDAEVYIAATYTSSLFGFVDDFEARVDMKQGAINFRSASREGHSDLGVNKKRLKQVMAELQQKL